MNLTFNPSVRHFCLLCLSFAYGNTRLFSEIIEITYKRFSGFTSKTTKTFCGSICELGIGATNNRFFHLKSCTCIRHSQVRKYSRLFMKYSHSFMDGAKVRAAQYFNARSVYLLRHKFCARHMALTFVKIFEYRNDLA